jgi:hypothetical protein
MLPYTAFLLIWHKLYVHAVLLHNCMKSVLVHSCGYSSYNPASSNSRGFCTIVLHYLRLRFFCFLVWLRKYFNSKDLLYKEWIIPRAHGLLKEKRACKLAPGKIHIPIIVKFLNMHCEVQTAAVTIICYKPLLGTQGTMVVTFPLPPLGVYKPLTILVRWFSTHIVFNIHFGMRLHQYLDHFRVAIHGC